VASVEKRFMSSFGRGEDGELFSLATVCKYILTVSTTPLGMNACMFHLTKF